MSVDFLSKNFPPFQVHHAKKPPRFYPDGFQRNVIDFYFIFSDCRLRKALYLQFSYFIWPLWAVTLIGGLFIWVLSFVMILSVYGRFFKMYMYTALAPVPLSAFAGEPTQNIGKSFMKSYASVCLEGAIIVLACIIFSVFASSPPVVDPNAAPASMVWSYIGELIFNMLILVGAVKMADRLVKEMMGI